MVSKLQGGLIADSTWHLYKWKSKVNTACAWTYRGSQERCHGGDKCYRKWKPDSQVEELFCSETVTGGLHGQLTFLSAFNIFLSIAAFLGNTVILVALHKETSTHPPSKLLYRNLAITDLCVGMVAEPLAVTYWTSVVN